jgi:redox-sensitive bicupin YhaK (pirin superfamily)
MNWKENIMQRLTFDQLPQGGFAGLIERRFVTDSRVFGRSRDPSTAEGIGNFVYLADANFLPKGETGLHPHREVDVISVMVGGRITHAGSLEHGQEIAAGTVQVQRAGGEGFSHNEINPDEQENHMIQLWVLPDRAGEAAGYKVYQPVAGGRTRIYGGREDQDETFYSRTAIDIVNAEAGQTFTQEGEAMAYLPKGIGTVNGEPVVERTLIRSSGLTFTADEDAQLILIYENDE